MISSWSALISTILVVKMYPEITDIQLLLGLVFLVLLNAMCFLPKHSPIKTIFVGREVQGLVETRPTLIWMVLVFIVVFAISITPRACEFIGQASLRALGIGGGIEKRIVDVKSTKKDLPSILFDEDERGSSENRSKNLYLILNSGSYSYFGFGDNIYKIKNDNFIEITQIPKG